MADFSLDCRGRFDDGTTLDVYQAYGPWVGPVGARAAQGTVSSGICSLTGLAEHTRYHAYSVSDDEAVAFFTSEIKPPSRGALLRTSDLEDIDLEQDVSDFATHTEVSAGDDASETVAATYTDESIDAFSTSITGYIDGRDQEMETALTEEINGPVSIHGVAGDYTLVHTDDRSRVVEWDDDAEGTITVPLEASQDPDDLFEVGDIVDVYNQGSATLTVEGETAGMLKPDNATLEQFESGVLRYRGSDAWAFEVGVSTFDMANAREFGAVGDYVLFGGGSYSDDTEALQQTLDAAGPGGIARIPAGVYKITETLNVHEDTIVVGDGGGQYSTSYNNDAATTTIVKTNANNGTGLYTNDAATGKFNYPSGINEACMMVWENCQIRDIAFSGPVQMPFLTAGRDNFPAGNPDYGIYGADAEHRNNLVLSGVMGRYFAEGAVGGYLHQAWFKNCTFAANMRGIRHGHEVGGDRMSNEGSDNTIDGCTIRHNALDGMIWYNAYLRVSNCRIEWNAQHGLWGTSQYLIIGNLFDRNGWNGVCVGAGPTIVGNYFDRNGCGGDGSYGRDITCGVNTTRYSVPPTNSECAHIQIRQAGGTGAKGVVIGNRFDARRGTSNKGAKAPRYIISMEGTTAVGTRFTGNDDVDGYITYDNTPTTVTGTNATSGQANIHVAQGDFFTEDGLIFLADADGSDVGFYLIDSVTFDDPTPDPDGFATGPAVVNIDGNLSRTYNIGSLASPMFWGQYWNSADGASGYEGGDDSNPASPDGTVDSTTGHGQPRLLITTAFGVCLRTKAGAAADSDFKGFGDAVPDGLIQVNTSGDDLNFRSGGAWYKIDGTAL